MNTHGLRIEVGKHAGELYTRLPVNYLRWMVNVRHAGAPIAQAELDRRGTSNPLLDITGHAIDRATQGQCLDVYLATRDRGEGLHAWLLRITEAAMASDHEPAKPGKYVWPPLVLVVETTLAWPVLKTVMYSPKACKLPRTTQDPDNAPDPDEGRIHE